MVNEMLTLEHISKYFTPQIVKRNFQGILVEYLQYELLDSIFKNKYANGLSFIGGTAIRILYQSQRFSEDLDFDNFTLTFRQFETLLGKSCKDMQKKGFLIEYRTVEKGAYHCYIKFPSILYDTGISGHREKKILIRIDSENKEKNYDPQIYLLNKFAVYRRIQTTPTAILLSQKMMTILLRKREKGRDIFDVSFLSGLTSPDFQYIENSINMNKETFIKRFNERIATLDLEMLATDVEPFLFDSNLKERVSSFREYWRQWEIII